MNRHHEDVLADIERRVRTDEASLDEVDAAIAAELGVPAEYYFAYLLVWAAIEAYRHGRTVSEAEQTATAAAPAEGLASCQSLVERIGWHGATIYQQATELGPLATEIADHASKILGAALTLGQNLRDLTAAHNDCRDSDGGQAVRS